MTIPVATRAILCAFPRSRYVRIIADGVINAVSCVGAVLVARRIGVTFVARRIA
jgi:hypothetical protein